MTGEKQKERKEGFLRQFNNKPALILFENRLETGETQN